MSKILVISGHPDLSSSNANRLILEKLTQEFSNLEVRRLDQYYADYQIDIEAEQAALIEADIIILQFPFYWYSVPALMKKWIDDVFSYNFAYGNDGDKLKNKDFILSFTVGGPEQSYNAKGYNHFDIAQLLRPLQQTAYLTGMTFQPPVYSHSMVYIANVYNTLEGVKLRSEEHADRLNHQIKALLNSNSDVE